jgi:hypothetical protein
MKKMLLVAAVIGLTMTSCKKDYTCQCIYTKKFTLGNNYSKPDGSPITVSNTTGKMKKDEAIKKCEQYNGTVVTSSPSDPTQFGTSTTTDCKIR